MSVPCSFPDRGVGIRKCFPGLPNSIVREPISPYSSPVVVSLAMAHPKPAARFKCYRRRVNFELSDETEVDYGTKWLGNSTRYKCVSFFQGIMRGIEPNVVKIKVVEICTVKHVFK